MATRKSASRGEKCQNALSGKTCRDCAKSYDWHNKALDGHLILCRCPHKREGGKWCIFLSDPACELFEPRKETPYEQVR